MAEILLSIRVTSPRRLMYHCYYYAKCHVLKIQFFHAVVLKDGPALLRGCLSPHEWINSFIFETG